jgi:LysM repeat protein
MRKSLRALLLAVAIAPVTAACLFGGSPGPASVDRPKSIPTATPPAKLPDPIVVGEGQVNAAPAAAVAGQSTYVVKPGDTLGSIAATLGVPPSQQAAWVQQVLQLNGIPDATLLRAGVELVLPRLQATPRPTGTAAASATPARTATSSPAAAATAAATATPRPTVAATAGGGTYTVQSGDYPLLIAQKLGVPPAQQSAWANQLVALNGIDPSNLQVGTVLQLPPVPAGGATPTP